MIDPHVNAGPIHRYIPYLEQEHKRLALNTTSVLSFDGLNIQTHGTENNRKDWLPPALGLLIERMKVFAYNTCKE